MRAQSGLTLIELCITLSIVLIIGGIATPSMRDLLDRMRVNTALSAMTVDLASARMHAVSKGRDAVLCPSTDGDQCRNGVDWADGWLLFEDRNGNRRRDLAETPIHVYAPKPHSRLKIRSTAGRRSVVYRPDGFSAGANVTIEYCMRERLHARLVVNNAGRVRVERPAGQPACPA